MVTKDENCASAVVRVKLCLGREKVQETRQKMRYGGRKFTVGLFL